MKKITLNAALSGLAGEYLVVAELIKLGHIATLTSKNAKGIDIVVFNADTTKTIGIQVKTNKGSNHSWVLNRKIEDYHAENLFYVFCNLNAGNGPSFFIVPSETVSTFAKKFHTAYLSKPGLKGQNHKDTNMRKFVDDKNEYLSRWELLGL